MGGWAVAPMLDKRSDGRFSGTEARVNFAD